MTAIPAKFGAGGSGLQPGHGSPDLATTLREVADDLAELKTKYDALQTAYDALLAKMDADSGVGDTDYVATVAGPGAAAAMKTTKV